MGRRRSRGAVRPLGWAPYQEASITPRIDRPTINT
jgi:hypothetical protein